MTSGDLNITIREKFKTYFQTYLMIAVERFFYRVFQILFEFRVFEIFELEVGGNICPPSPTHTHYGEVGSDRHWGAG